MRNNHNEIIDACALTPRERCLLPFLFGKRLTEADMQTLTDGLDIDCESQNFLLMFACLGYAQGWELFPQEIIPRLKGLHRYYQVTNTLQLHWLTENIRILRRAGIPVMLIKGLALRFYYAVGIPRLMGDYDIAVPEDRYEEAMAQMRSANDVCKDLTSPHHSQIVTSNRILELHRWIFKQHGERGTDIWERAVHFQFQGMDVCVPCPEDMFIHLLDNRSRDIVSGDYPLRRLQWLCDCRRILEKCGAMDLRSVAARAEEFGVTFSMRHMLMSFSTYFPEVFSTREVDLMFPQTAHYRRWYRLGCTYRKLLMRYNLHHYTKANAFTPLRICRSLWLRGMRYRFLRCERGPSYHLRDFLEETFKVDHLGELFAKYRSRIRLFDWKGVR